MVESAPPSSSVSCSTMRSCSIGSWYPALEAHTFKTRFVNLPQSFIAYLHEDGMYAPEAEVDPNERVRWGATEAGEDGDDANSDEDTAAKTVSFPELEAAIRSHIEELGGAVVPKLNWSTPKDATWISATHDLKCMSPGDVFMLLKASDNITHDLDDGLAHCDDADSSTKVEPLLALREWFDLQPSMEFRCFVRDRIFLGASQRDSGNFYAFLLEREGGMIDAMEDFYEDVLREKFSEPSFVFDVYLSRRNKVYLVDINPFCDVTDPLLYTWDELDTMGGTPEFEGAIQRSVYTSNRVPKDVVFLANAGGIERFCEDMEARRGNEDHSADEESENE